MCEPESGVSEQSGPRLLSPGVWAVESSQTAQSLTTPHSHHQSGDKRTPLSGQQ